MRQVPHNLKVILPFFTVIILDSMGTGMMLPVLAPLIHARHGILSNYSKAEQHFFYGMILGLWPFCFMLGAPVFGCLSDHWGRKRILLICLFGTLMSFVFYIVSFHWAFLSLLLIGRVVGGITSGSQGVAQAAIAEVSNGKEKAVNIALIAVAMTIGLIVGPLLGGVLSDKQLVSWFNNTTPFYVAGLLAILNIIFLFRYLNDNVVRVERHDLIKRIFKILNNHQLLVLLITFFCFELGWSLYFQSLALLLFQKFHFTNAWIGLFSSYVGLVLSLALLIIVRLIMRFWSFSQTIHRSLWLLCISLFAVFLLPGIDAQYLFVIPIAIAVAACYSSMIALASDWMGEGQGLLMGITDAILALAFSVTGFLSGVLAYWTPSLPQFIAAIFMLLALFVSKKLRR